MTLKLAPTQLCLKTDTREFEFTTSDDIEPGLPCLGQERAVEALRTGLSIPGPGFHILALGAEGIGRTDCIFSVLSEFAPTDEATSDRCLLPGKAHQGMVEELELPAGRGQVLIEGCAELIRATSAKDSQQRKKILSELTSSFADQTQLTDFLSRLDLESALQVESDSEQADVRPLLQMLPQCIVEGETDGIPCQIDRSPDPASLLGTCTVDPDSGTTLLNAGSLLQASGGCLLVDGRLLAENIAWWRSLRDVLRTGFIPLGSIPAAYPTQQASPAPLSGYLRLTAKVILLCDQYVLDRLQEIEPDMERIFPVIAEFDSRVERNSRSIDDSARIMAAAIQQYGCLPFNRDAMALMMDISSLISGSRDKLSLYRSGLSNLLREASHIAHQSGDKVVTPVQVQAVIDQRKSRVAIARKESIQAIIDGETLVELNGSVVGQANGLTVVGSGVQAYIEPARITAAVRAGEGAIIDIERETELGGSIHSKGILILAGLLGSRYSPHESLSLIASLVVEQNYSELDGDSASLAEALALLSAIAGIPLKQSFAITGSIDQRGQVQCIGEVNMKIEGYFELCSKAGLDGSHGVIIPSGNINDLMLDKEVVQAVKQGQFSIYAVTRLDQAIELLTDMSAGERDDKGEFPSGSFNHTVVTAVHQYAEEKKQQDHKDD
jgi:predicted ATP-dependent protease